MVKSLLVAAATVLALAFPGTSAFAKTAVGAPVATPPTPVVSPEVNRGVSPPVRSMTRTRAGNGRTGEIPLRRLPQRAPGGASPDVQTRIGGALAPATTTNFDGIGAGFTGPAGTFTVGAAPPDTNGAVGPNNFVQIVNTDFAVFNKSGTVLAGPLQINSLWQNFGGGCQTNNDGDPGVKYDSMANRWIITQFSVSTTPYLQCVAISQTSDPTGAYYLYSFQYSEFPDYPKISVWPDAYYITFNMFGTNGATFTGGQVCAYNRSAMLNGMAATQQCFNVGTNYGGLLTSDVDGSRLPPAGSPNYVVALGTTTTQLAFWKFHVDWTTPSNTTLTGPTALTVAGFSEACNGGTCIPQSGTTQQLDSLGDRLMYRLAYRNFGDHESLVVNHSVTAGTSTGVRWYEIRSPGTTPTIYQQGTFAPDSSYRWMGSIAMDGAGNMAMGYSVSSINMHPAIGYTGRLVGDPLGQMTQGEGIVITGAGSQTTNLSRWGDYSSIVVDPSDDCTFWYTNEYIPANGTFNWKTRIASFKLPNCGTTTNDFSISASPSSQSVVQGSSTTYTISTAITSGVAQTVSLSASGLPSGATASFNPASINSGQSSTMTVSTAASTPTGTFTITVTGTGTSATHSTTVSLTVTAAGGGGGIVNGGFETGDFSGWTTTGTTSISSTAHTGTHSAMLGANAPTNGDSSIAQTFTVPSGSGTLSFWYQVHCLDTVQYDWATATLKDNTANTTTTMLSNTCVNSSTWSQATATVTVGHSYTLTLISHDDNSPGDQTYTLYDDVALSAPPPPPPSGITNGDFETGNLNGWTTTGTTSISSPGHTGSYAAMAGSTAPTNGDSTLNQTFTAGTGATRLTLWYANTCPDTVQYDWMMVTLKDNTTGTTTTMVGQTCAASSAWTQASASVVAGHSYTLTLLNHDENSPGDPTYTLFDDVALS